ncbi:dihydrofolate reductase [Clostridium sp.]|uniref:dihydrofolate reductase n=1 Tax=Clostridium sp. TaxID=1506 RepID=UPI00260D749D|nr:dihydrofolate reductase [Clostridium sp.]
MISLIVAVAKNNVIGNNSIIPWKIKGERKRFKELTIGKTIIMGRKSFKEIGKPLPNRKTILISNTKHIELENCTTVSSFMEVVELAKNEDEIFIAGGGQVYKESFPYADKIYITVIDKIIDGNVYFPKISDKDFVKTYEKRIDTYYTYERRN